MISLQGLALTAGLFLAPLCAAGLALASRRWTALGMLMGVFAGAALVLGASLSTRIGLGLLLAGALCCAILDFGLRRSGWRPDVQAWGSIPGGRGFRLAAILLVGVAAWGLAASAAPGSMPVSPARLGSAAFVLAIGLLQLGLSQEQGSVGLGLLATLVGFETLYATLEPSLALRAVLAALMLGIALVTSLLLESPADVGAGDRRRG